MFPKIADFGLSKAEKAQNTTSKNFQQKSIPVMKGILQYMSPESLNKLTYSKSK